MNANPSKYQYVTPTGRIVIDIDEEDITETDQQANTDAKEMTDVASGLNRDAPKHQQALIEFVTELNDRITPL